MRVETLPLLGTPLCLIDYAGFAAACQAWAREDRCVAVEFANTHIVAMRRHDPSFRLATRELDVFVPDGMPLIWCLNLAGAGLHDRVYGPTFMREFLSEQQSPSTHYLVGGSELCGERLRRRFSEMNPHLRFLGGFHGRCGSDGLLEGSAERDVINEINRLAPDFIWVGLGAPKQELWVQRHKRLLRRGVILTVGFAFDVNAGLKPDAPPWMQRRGLTWVFRVCSEPRRLALRYLRYNGLFLSYLLWDGLRLRAWKRRLEASAL